MIICLHSAHMQAVSLTFPLLQHSRPLLMSPYGLYVSVTAHVLNSAPHISHTSPPSCSSLRWKRMFKESKFESYWQPLIKMLRTNRLKALQNFTRHLLYVTNILRYAMLMHAALWILPDCGSLLAWTLIIKLMRRQRCNDESQSRYCLDVLP